MARQEPKLNDIVKNTVSGIIILFLGWIALTVNNNSQKLAVLTKALEKDISYIKEQVIKNTHEIAIIRNKKDDGR